jgi:hypothetical protein
MKRRYARTKMRDITKVTPSDYRNAIMRGWLKLWIQKGARIVDFRAPHPPKERSVSGHGFSRAAILWKSPVFRARNKEKAKTAG